MEKIYQVDCTFETTGLLYIKAGSAEEAIKQAQRLLDDGRGEVENDTGGGNSTADTCHEATYTDERIKAAAEINAGEFLEIEAEEAALN